MDIFNKKKIKKLENTIFSLQQDLITEKNINATYKEILRNSNCSTLLLEENKQLIEWIKSVLETFGTMEVHDRIPFHIPVYRKVKFNPFEQNEELRKTTTETIVIPSIIIHEQKY